MHKVPPEERLNPKEALDAWNRDLKDSELADKQTVEDKRTGKMEDFGSCWCTETREVRRRAGLEKRFQAVCNGQTHYRCGAKLQQASEELCHWTLEMHKSLFFEYLVHCSFQIQFLTPLPLSQLTPFPSWS